MLTANHDHTHNFISNETKNTLSTERKFKLHETITSSKLQEEKLKNVSISNELKKQGLVLVNIENGLPIFLGPLNAGSIKTMSAEFVKENSGQSNSYNLNGSGITVGVWDGGKVRSTHQEFLNANNVSRISYGSDNGGTNIDSHATHVAGTIAAKGTKAAAIGVASKVLIKSYDFGSDVSEMSSEASSLKLSNHSYGVLAGWGSNNCYYGAVNVSEDIKFGKYSSIAYSYDNIAYSNTLYTIVFAAGNDRGDNGSSTHKHLVYDNGWSCKGSYTCSHPKDGGTSGFDIITGGNGAKNVITVAAINELSNGWQSNDTGTISSFSSFGPMDDGRIKPDISAKGVAVYSTESSSDTAYGNKNGTSMATPGVTGGLALLMEYQKKIHGAMNLLSSSYKAIMIHTADEAGTTAGPDYKFGWGVLNIFKSVELMKRNKYVNNTTIQEINYNGTEQTILIKNADPQVPLVVTAVWTDPPSPIYNQTPYKNTVDATNKALVNDIDIKIEQGATTHYPWKLSVSNPGNAATNIARNDVDNVEQIRINNPSGNYTLKLYHTGNLYQSKNQPVSLIISYAKKPTISIPGNPNTASATHTLSGTSQSNTTVNIFVNNTLNNSIKSAANGTWSKTITFPSTGTLNIQVKTTENINARTQNTLNSVVSSSNIIVMNYNGIVITSPIDNTNMYMPTVNIKGETSAAKTVKIFENNNLKSTIQSDANGKFEKVINLDKDGKATLNATIVSGANTITSNTVILNVDIYKPQIISPTLATITTPTFNMVGTSEPNKLVNIFKKPSSGSYTFVKSGTANAQGTFNILIQLNPTSNPSEYQQSFNFIASSNVSVGSSTLTKESTPKSIQFNIKDFPTTITNPSPNTVIYTPTFNLMGTAKKDNQVSALKGSTLVKSGIANIGADNNGLKQFSLAIQSPKTATLSIFNYKVTTNIYTLPRESNTIPLKFDVFKPRIMLPTHNSTISTPTFNLSGKTEPNVNVDIIKDNRLIASVNATSTGSFNAIIRYDFNGQNQVFKTSANVSIDSGKSIKVSSSKTYQFNVKDIRPIIQLPTNNDQIFSKKLTIRGKTGVKTIVNLYKDASNTPLGSTTSDSNGFFSFSVINPSQENGPTINSNFFVKATVYAKEYTSPSINLKFKLDSNAPEIIYPKDSQIIKSNRVTFIGNAQKNSKVFIFERLDGSQNDQLIGATKSNNDKKWSFDIPIKVNKIYFYKAKVEKIPGKPSSVVESNEIKVISQLNSSDPYIVYPRSLEEIKTNIFNVMGSGKKNSIVSIYQHASPNIIIGNLMKTTTSNNKGKWSSVVKSPKNNHYFLTAIITSGNYRATSNTVSFKMNYDFKGQPLSIDSHKNNDTTHKKRIKLFGKSPNGTLQLFVNDQLLKSIIVSNNRWISTMNLNSEKAFKVQVKITHNALIKESSIINISRNSKPKITKTSSKRVSKNKFQISGVGKETTLLTITMIENSLTMMTKQLETMASSQKEIVIGQVNTDDEGSWSIDIPISAPGKYSFKVYENYGTESQLASENFEYDISLESTEVSLNLGPSPFNPSSSTLKIEYLLPSNSNVDIGIYSITGFKVYGKAIASGTIGAIKGRNILVWDGKSDGAIVPPGLYIVVIKVDGDQSIIKTKRVGIRW